MHIMRWRHCALPEAWTISSNVHCIVRPRDMAWFRYMGAVPKESRTFAVAVCVVIIHGLGDVPSPIFIGWLSDQLTPRRTLTLVTVWLVVPVLLWCVGCLCSSRAERLPGGSASGKRRLSHYPPRSPSELRTPPTAQPSVPSDQ